MYCGVPATIAGLRQAGVGGGPGQAEVGDLDPLDAVFQQDVGRLDVAVDQPLGVGGGQAGGRLHADAQDLVQLRAARRGRAAPAATCPATYCMTRYGRPSASSTAWMVTTWSWLTAAAAWASREEALAGGGAGRQLRGQHLDGHDAVQLLVEGPQHDAHAAAADHFQHLVMAQPAERARLVRGAQKTEIVAALASRGWVASCLGVLFQGRHSFGQALHAAVFAETRRSARAFAAVLRPAAGARHRRRRHR